MEEHPLTCNLGALTEAERARWANLTDEFRRAVRSVRELPAGAAVEFSAGSFVRDDLDELIGFEKRCCAFLAFAVDREGEIVTVSITGPPGVKEFLVAEFGLVFD